MYVKDLHIPNQNSNFAENMNRIREIECSNCERCFTVEVDDKWTILPKCPYCGHYEIIAR